MINLSYDTITKPKDHDNDYYAKIFDIPVMYNEELWQRQRQFTVRLYMYDSRGVWRSKDYAVGINHNPDVGGGAITPIIGDLTPQNDGPELVATVENNLVIFWSSGIRGLFVKVQMLQCDNISLYNFHYLNNFDTELLDCVKPVAVPNNFYNINPTSKKLLFGYDVNGGYGTMCIGLNVGKDSTAVNSFFCGRDIANNSTGEESIIFGISNATEITTSKNLAIFGRNCLRNLITGDSNSVFANQGLYSLVSGNNNLVVGSQGLYYLANGDNNISLGNGAGRNEADGTKNDSSNDCIFIGKDTRSSTNLAINEVVIGNNATGAGDNTVQLGNASMVSAFIGGNRLTRVVEVPTTTTATGTKGDISGDANYLYYCYDTNLWIRIPKDDTWT